jgi:CRISPR/Cas system type I-B associated protein Csh2 (Cas7 group RAMP superfamily)
LNRNQQITTINRNPHPDLLFLLSFIMSFFRTSSFFTTLVCVLSLTVAMMVSAVMGQHQEEGRSSPLDWTFTCQREGNYNNDACNKELDTTLWEEVLTCIADVTGQEITPPNALPWYVDDEKINNSAMEEGNNVGSNGKHVRGRARGLLARGGDSMKMEQMVSLPSFFGGDLEAVANAAGMTERDAEETHRRLQDCFSASVNCSYWSYPNGLCCRLHSKICSSSTKNPCKRRRMDEQADEDEDYDDEEEDEEGSSSTLEYPYKAEVAAMHTECTARLQNVCSDLDQDKLGVGCLGSCESLKCGGYIFE